MILMALLSLANVANALEFTRALKCDARMGAKDGPWCLEREYLAGRNVYFLNRKDCRATTGNSHSIATEEDESAGTELVEFSCPNASELEPVLFDVPVKEFKQLEVKELTDEKETKGLAAKIKKHPLFNALTKRAPDHERLGPPLPAPHLYEISRAPNRKTRVVTYTQDGELPFLLEGGKLTPLVEEGGLAAMEVSAIRLNGKDFVALKMCDIGGGGCGDKYIELGK